VQQYGEWNWMLGHFIAGTDMMQFESAP